MVLMFRNLSILERSLILSIDIVSSFNTIFRRILLKDLKQKFKNVWSISLIFCGLKSKWLKMTEVIAIKLILVSFCLNALEEISAGQIVSSNELN